MRCAAIVYDFSGLIAQLTIELSTVVSKINHVSFDLGKLECSILDWIHNG